MEPDPRPDWLIHRSVTGMVRPAIAAPGGHWYAHARQWRLIGSPLRPHRDDVENLLQAFGASRGVHLLLGLTPEYATLFDRLVAVDCNSAMIAALGRAIARNMSVIQGNWLNMPLRADSCDACIGDGVLNLFAYPAQYPPLFEQLRRVLRLGAKMALRAFVRPDKGEACETVCALAMQGRIGSFHAFKWRLAMAIAHESGDANVPVAAIRDTFVRLLPDRKALATINVWGTETIDTIDAYANATACYSFPTLLQLRAALPAYLKEVGLKFGGYELAERCPMLVLERSR